MWQLWRARPILTSAFVLAAALMVFFAGRIAVRTLYWANPAHHNQTLAPWMTVGYIARSWDVKPTDLDALAKLPPPTIKGHPQPLIEIARDRGVPTAQLITEVQAALTVLIAQRDLNKAAKKASKDKTE